ncbi:PEGA domain-containing protein [Bradyrhizobium ontarionense]|uniref:PEGA domain-containing protein n=1 Tax=Bradyrhizobium ontarionense TaxID=2898149 RepID=A0ABY3RFN7_9BRAD|nr:PEGA domain-containing protein [Bradyrhizobium sp. A19]UFZ06264.1 PEGA domain-containing protein [Bradyrhizobium sp. A19]
MRVVAFVALCAALGGCASVTRGTTETISVASTPSGAEATIAGLEAPMTCTTPCSFVAKRNADLAVTVDKPGYESQTITLTKDIPAAGAAGFAGNVLAGGLIGMGVDAATGAATDHKPNPVIVTLQPRGAAPRAARPPRRSAPPPAQPEAGT